MSVNKYAHILAVPLAVLFILGSTACSKGGQKQSPQQQSAKQQQQTEKEPQKLKDMEASIEEIVKALDGPAVSSSEEKDKGASQKNAQSKSSGQGGQGSQSTQQEQTGSKEQSKSSQQGSQQQGTKEMGNGQQPSAKKPEQPQPQAKDPWSEVEGIIAKLHYQWNDYMPDAAKKGASLQITDNFSSALNHLTVTAPKKDKNEALKAANGVYAFIPDLHSLYRTRMSPEIKRMAYLTRNIILNSVSDNWSQADKDMGTLDSSWSIARNSLGKEQQKDSGKLDFSITELKKVVKEKNKQLTDIKGRVALSNIGAMMKSYDKESEQGGSS